MSISYPPGFPYQPATDAEARAEARSDVFLTPSNLKNRASFLATVSPAQTGILNTVTTKINCNSVIINNGNFYDAVSCRWVPPAGMVRLGAFLYSPTGWVGPGYFYGSIYKNGSRIGIGAPTYYQDAVERLNQCHTIDLANGTDYYELFVLMSTTGNGQIAGPREVTSFYGEQI